MKNVFALAAILFVFSMALHAAPSLQSAYPLGIDSYYFLRIAKTIESSGFIQQDPLSYGGRPFTYPPGLPYILGVLAAFSDIEFTGLLLTLIIGSLTTVLVFLLGLRFGKKEAFFAAALYATVPVVIWKSSVITNAAYEIFLLLLVVYMLETRRKFYIVPFVVLLFFSPAAAIIAALFSLAYAKHRSEKLQAGALVILSLCAASLYAGSFAQIYVSKIIPQEIISSIYPDLSPAEIFYRINPFVLAAAAVSALVYVKRNNFPASCRKFSSLQKSFFAFTCVLILLLCIRFAEPDRLLYYLAIPTSLACGHAFSLAKNNKIVYGTFFICLAGSLLLAVNAYNDLRFISPDANDAQALLALDTDKNATILSAEINGHMVSYFTGRKNFMDGNLIGADIGPRYDDAKIIYGTDDSTVRKNLMEKNNITHIFFSHWEAERFSTDVSSLDNDKNLRRVISKGKTVVYERV